MAESPNLTWRFLISCVAICLGALPVLAQAGPPEQPKSSGGSPAAPPPGTRPAEATTARAGRVADPADLEAFFDGVLPMQRESKHIAGAVVAVVVGDKLVFAKGYGYADVAERRKVDPDKTLFRIASITKLFTATAVMQQVEEGKLDLDSDVNTWLTDVQVSPAYGQPITLTHLLTHTPGFDDQVLGLFGRNQASVRPLADVLRAQMPTRVRPPGVIASYSNHGTAIAGYAVACASGLSWEDYIKERILKPLGMDHTLVRQPDEDQLPADLSRGYRWQHGRFEAKGFEYVPAAPAGCISTTAADAARFMRAHLGDGRLGDGRILRPETARRMREPLFRNDPKASAMCYGFMESWRHGLRILGHGGDTMWFRSLMQLIPERQVGLFVSYNTDTSTGAREELFDAFLRRYFPEPDPPRLEAVGGFRERAGRLTGEYGMTRYSHTTPAKLAALLSGLEVSVNEDDTLTIGTMRSSARYVEVEPFVFRELDGKRKVVFQVDDQGQVLYLFFADAPPVSAVRRAWYERSVLHLGLAAGCFAILASALLFWPVIAFSIRGLSSPRITRTRFSGLLSCLGWCLGLVSLVIVLGLALALSDPNELVFGLTPLARGILATTQFGALLAVLTVLGCFPAWKYHYWRLSGRLHYTLVALAGVGFIWLLYYWNLLTVGFPGS